MIRVGLYNLWAFGSVTRMSYSAAVSVQGRTGHAKLGLNDHGFFGIGVPRLDNFVHLLIAPRGLITTSPVIIAGLVGAVLMYRRGHRPEARTILGMVALHLVYNSGYWLPFGGGTPGPRFLIPCLPFLGLGLVFAWRRIPATTLVLSAASAVVMSVITVTGPLVGFDSVYLWWSRVQEGLFMQTVWTQLGAGRGPLTILPTLLLFAGGVALAGLCTRRAAFSRDWKVAIGALAAWLVVDLAVVPQVREDPRPVPSPDVTEFASQLVLTATVVALISLAGVLLIQRLRAGGATGSLAA